MVNMPILIISLVAFAVVMGLILQAIKRPPPDDPNMDDGE